MSQNSNSGVGGAVLLGVVGTCLFPAFFGTLIVGGLMIAAAGRVAASVENRASTGSPVDNPTVSEEVFAALSHEERLKVIRAGMAPPVGLERILKLDPQMLNTVYVSPERLAMLPDRQLTAADIVGFPPEVRTTAFQSGLIPQSVLHQL